MGAAHSFEDALATHADGLEGLLPDEQDLATQRSAMRAWYEGLEDDDVVWCIGDAAGAYGLLAAERVGSERVVVFDPDRSRVPTVEDALFANGHDEVTVETMSFLGWQRHGVSAEGVVDAYSDDPVGDVVEALQTPDRPSVLLFDVPGYAGGLLSTLSVGQQRCVESVLLKTTDTLAQSQLQDAGFETRVVAQRDGVRPPWRRALWASRDAADVPVPEIAEQTSERGGTSADGTSARDENDQESWHSSILAQARAREAWRLRDLGYLVVAVVLYVLAGLFNVVAIALELLARSPLRRLAGRALVGVVIAGLFVLFLALATVLAELGQLFGASETAGAGAAGIIVISIPVLGALFFLQLALKG